MEKKRIRLIALDLDGTLVGSDGMISEENQNAIRDAVQAGNDVVISTGRPYAGVPTDRLEPLGVRYAITANGAGVYRIPEKECLFSACYDWKLASELLQKLMEYRVHFDVFVNGNAYSQKAFLPMIEERLGLSEAGKHYLLTTRRFLDDAVAFIEETRAQVEKITVNFCPLGDGRHEDYEQVYDLLSSYPEITFLSGGSHNLEITRAGVEKGMGLRYLADLLEIPLEETMACGDTPNDLNIMKTAGVAVAMGNADQEVKELADFITLTNDEDGVAYAIRKYVLS